MTSSTRPLAEAGISAPLTMRIVAFCAGKLTCSVILFQRVDQGDLIHIDLRTTVRRNAG
ncbi:MAG: hypothetical protein KF726_05210 [Anaerolineae bacterium]|nr:hypothetical protein [Anaerolineae bacterium]